MATVKKHILEQFENVFEEPSVYDVTRFNVQDAAKAYRTVYDDWIIVIRTDTKVVKVAEATDTIPRFKFYFADEDALVNRLYHINRLTDLGGILRAITSEYCVTTSSGTSTVKRELHVETDRNCTVVLPLWAGQRKLIDESIPDKFSKSPRIVVSSLTVATYGRTFIFNSTKATKIYLDINDFHLNEIRARIQNDEGKKITYIDQSDAKSHEKNENIECTIAQLLSDVRSVDCKGRNYVVPATIVKIKTTSPWSYLSCPFYKAFVRMDDTQYFCNNCHRMSDKPLNRYRLNVDILDSTTSTTITVFDKEAEGLIGQKVDDMITISKSDNGAQKVSNIFQQLSGNQAIFEFKPNNYEMNNPGSMLTVRKITKQTMVSKLIKGLSQVFTRFVGFKLIHDATVTHHKLYYMLLPELTPPSDQSSTVEFRTPSSKDSSQLEMDLKGKSKIDQNAGDGTDTMPPATRMEQSKRVLRRGIVINDEDDLHDTPSSHVAKLREKRQKK